MITESDYLKEWILDFLSKPQELLNGFPPCPYAKKALIDNKIIFCKSEDYVTDIPTMMDNWDDSYDVLVCIVPDDVDANTFIKDVSNINNLYQNKGFVCLEDHKDIIEQFHSLSFNNGKYNIIVCQRSEKLKDATEVLQSKGYYNNWPKELYDDVVAWRLNSN